MPSMEKFSPISQKICQRLARGSINDRMLKARLCPVRHEHKQKFIEFQTPMPSYTISSDDQPS